MGKQQGKRALTERQRLFVEAWTGEAKGNGVQAARMAGYRGNDRVLAVQAADTLTKPNVIEAIRAATAQARSAAVATRKERQAELTRILRSEVDEEVLMVVGMGVGAGDQIARDTKKPDVRARLKAIEMLGRMQGDFIDKLEVKTEGSFRTKMERLKKELSPGAWQELLLALTKAST